MDRRYIAVVALSLPLLWGAACSGTDARGREPDRLMAVLTGNPEADGSPSERIVVTWVFRAEDCLSCQAFPGEIRRVLKDHVGSIRFAAVQVGEPDDTAVTNAFFRREQLNPHYIQMSPAAYRATFGILPLPAIYVVVNGRLLRVEFGDNAGAIPSSVSS